MTPPGSTPDWVDLMEWLGYETHVSQLMAAVLSLVTALGRVLLVSTKFSNFELACI